MEKWDTGFAKMFKERENKSPVGMVIGEVITGLPDLTVSINDEINLDTEQLIIANRLYTMHTHEKHTDVYSVTGGTVIDTYYTPIPVPLAAGDKVILMPADNEQIYFVLDKVGE